MEVDKWKESNQGYNEKKEEKKSTFKAKTMQKEKKEWRKTTDVFNENLWKRKIGNVKNKTKEEKGGKDNILEKRENLQSMKKKLKWKKNRRKIL